MPCLISSRDCHAQHWLARSKLKCLLPGGTLKTNSLLWILKSLVCVRVWTSVVWILSGVGRYLSSCCVLCCQVVLFGCCCIGIRPRAWGPSTVYCLIHIRRVADYIPFSWKASSVRGLCHEQIQAWLCVLIKYSQNENPEEDAFNMTKNIFVYKLFTLEDFNKK